MNVAELEFWNNFHTALVWVEAGEQLRLKDTIPVSLLHKMQILKLCVGRKRGGHS